MGPRSIGGVAQRPMTTYKYGPPVRVPQGVGSGSQAVHVQGQEPLTPTMLAAAPPQEQKQMLGTGFTAVFSSICCFFEAVMSNEKLLMYSTRCRKLFLHFTPREGLLGEW